jgi:hypothetical protein
VQQKPADELLSGGSRKPLVTGSVIVPSTESDLAINKVNQSMIVDGNLVGLALLGWRWLA